MKVKFFTIPNLLTLCNLICGTLAVFFAVQGASLSLCFWLVTSAAVFDFFDGAAARLLKQYSPLGVQLDSLSDMVSFGVAPSAVMLAIYRDAGSLWNVPDALGYGVIIIAAFSALRLAKFNIDTSQHEEFCGLPTPACALFCVGLGYASQAGRLAMPREGVLLTSLCLSVLLIVSVRLFSLKFRNFTWRDNSLRFCFLIASAAILVLTGPSGTPIVILLYVLLSLIRNAAGGRTCKAGK